MKKIGLVFDSSCGLTYDEAQQLGIGFIPLVIEVNGKEYKAGKDLFQKDLYELMSNRNAVIRTSSPKGEDIEAAFDKALENCEEAVYIGLSHKFSGTQNAVSMVAEQNEKYKGKIHIAPSEFSSPWAPLYVKEFIEIVDNYDDVDKFIKDVLKCHDFMVGYLSPGDIWWFYKGGRITKMQYMIGSIAKIVPILKVADGEIDKSQTLKARGKEKAMIKMVDAVNAETERLGLPKGFYKYIMLNTGNDALFEESVKTMCPLLGIQKEDVISTGLTVEQTAHMGPNSFGLTIYVSLKNIINGGLR